MRTSPVLLVLDSVTAPAGAGAGGSPAHAPGGSFTMALGSGPGAFDPHRTEAAIAGFDLPIPTSIRVLS
jgi:hypothetical protein